MTTHDRAAARVVRLVLAATAFAVALVLAGLSALGYEMLKEHLDPLSVDRDANLTPAEFDDIVWRLRLLAFGFVLLGTALLVLRRTIDPALAAVGRAWWEAARCVPAALRRWVESEAWPVVAALGTIVVVAAIVRILFLDVPLRYDEATTYNNFVSKPLHVALANYATPNNHVLHTLLAKLSVAVFGNGEWAIRLPALLAGIALVPATFALARTFYGRAAALLAAALVASSSTLVEYSTSARGYTLVALVTVLAFLAAARAVERDGVGAWAAVAVLGALGLYAVPVMLYALGGALLWILVSGVVAGRPARPLLGRLGVTALVTAVLTLLLYSPVYAASGVRSVTANEFVEPQSWSELVDLFPGHLGDTVETWTRDLPLAASVVLAVGLLVGIVRTPWIGRFPVPTLVAVAAWSLLVLAAQRVVPYTRVWLFLVPLAAATIAGFYGSLLERRSWGTRVAPVLAVALALAGSALVVAEDAVRDSRETGALLDAPSIADLLATSVGPDDRILATGSDTILEYYLEREGVDANPLLYTDELRARTFVVVNTLGGQTIDELLRQLPGADALSPPELLRSFESGRVYLVERRP